MQRTDGWDLLAMSLYALANLLHLLSVNKSSVYLPLYILWMMNVMKGISAKYTMKD